MCIGLTSAFQLTRSRGAWPLCISPCGLDFAFQLTRSRGAWHDCARYSKGKKRFQLTRSRGAWRSKVAKLSKISYFNSHAHVERDIAVLVINHKAGISTHTLTWSVTVYINQANGIKPISTHTLTWSVTRNSKNRSKRRRFQLTRSRGAWLYNDFTNNRSSKFQLTRSRGAWRRRLCASRKHPPISTHTLTWSVTKTWNLAMPIVSFQLTRSRGAWQLLLPAEQPCRNFNSHAHVERDLWCASHV